MGDGMNTLGADDDESAVDGPPLTVAVARRILGNSTDGTP
jgi:hypothetical protein